MVWALREEVETKEGRVAWGRAGAGPPAVLVHGWPWSSYAWHRVIPGLARDFTVYWYDMPGYGASEMRAGQRTGLDIQGEVLAGMIAHWGLERPAVIAHDIGGAAALRAHLLGRCDFGQLVMMNIVALRPWGSDFFDHVGRHVEAFAGLPPHIHAAVVGAYIRGALAHEIPAEDLAALEAPWLSAAGRASFYAQFAQADEALTAAFEPHLGALRCAGAILWGADDPWIPLARGKALSAAMPGTSFRELPGLGHLPQLEAPDIVLGHLRGLLTG